MLHRQFADGSRIAPANPSLSLPLRAAFYFPWYPEGWDQLGYTPFTRYTPSLGAYYDQADPAVIKQHLEWMRYAKVQALIAIWRGRDDGIGASATRFAGVQYNTDTKLAHLLDQALQHGIKVCIYYEVQGYISPTAAEIQAEFDWLAGNRFSHPAYLRVGGLPVIFVYSGGADSTVLGRYSTATSGFTTAYLNMIYNDGSTPAPQGRHGWDVGPTISVGNSYAIVPGFWRPDEGSPRVARDLTRWASNIASMVGSAKDWHLIISWNEWGEGSMIEPTAQFGMTYLDALAAVP